jgi:flagellar hook-associated protein 2
MGTASAETVTVASDPEAIQVKLEEMITAYNNIVSHIDVNSVYNADAALRGPFVGETSVSRVKNGIASIITTDFANTASSAAATATGLEQDFTALVLIGVQSGSDGKLTLDSETFEEILLDEPDQVATLFTDEDHGFISKMLEKLDVYIATDEGSLEVRLDSIDSRIEDIEDQVERYEDRVERTIDRLRSQFAAMESLLGTLSASSTYLATMLNDSGS